MFKLPVCETKKGSLKIVNHSEIAIAVKNWKFKYKIDTDYRLFFRNNQDMCNSLHGVKIGRVDFISQENLKNITNHLDIRKVRGLHGYCD